MPYFADEKGSLLTTSRSMVKNPPGITFAYKGQSDNQPQFHERAAGRCSLSSNMIGLPPCFENLR
jgi:hypothetical protein